MIKMTHTMIMLLPPSSSLLHVRPLPPVRSARKAYWLSSYSPAREGGAWQLITYRSVQQCSAGLARTTLAGEEAERWDDAQQLGQPVRAALDVLHQHQVGQEAANDDPDDRQQNCRQRGAAAAACAQCSAEPAEPSDEAQKFLAIGAWQSSGRQQGGGCLPAGRVSDWMAAKIRLHELSKLPHRK